MIEKIVAIIQFMRENIKVLKWGLFMFAMALIIFDIILHVDFFHLHAIHPHFFGDKIWVFWSIFGLVICFLLVYICKGVGHLWLMKGEDYYE